MDRDILYFEDENSDGVYFVILDDGLRVHCHSDFCGDTETGLGAEVGYNLTIEQAKELYRFLGKWIEPNAPITRLACEVGASEASV